MIDLKPVEICSGKEVIEGISRDLSREEKLRYFASGPLHWDEFVREGVITLEELEEYQDRSFFDPNNSRKYALELLPDEFDISFEVGKIYAVYEDYKDRGVRLVDPETCIGIIAGGPLHFTVDSDRVWIGSYPQGVRSIIDVAACVLSSPKWKDRYEGTGAPLPRKSQELVLLEYYEYAFRNREEIVLFLENCRWVKYPDVQKLHRLSMYNLFDVFIHEGGFLIFYESPSLQRLEVQKRAVELARFRLPFRSDLRIEENVYQVDQSFALSRALAKTVAAQKCTDCMTDAWLKNYWNSVHDDEQKIGRILRQMTSDGRDPSLE